MNLTYTITKFDVENKILVVSFDDGGWAEIRLVTPLPKNIEELEKLIAQFSAPVEAIEAQQNPDADLSYIDSVIGVQRTCPRMSLFNNELLDSQITEIDPNSQANAEMWADVQFQKKVASALIKFGLLQDDPTLIPTATL